MAGITNPLPLATALVSLIPAGAVFFFAYGRYDGLFRDNVVFLFFIGGLGIGAILSIFAVAMTLGSPVYLVTLVPLLYGILPTAALNRRKWQGDRHSVFNGGAMGIGVAAMTAFAFVYRDFAQGMTWLLAGGWAVVALGLALQQFAAGSVLGAGVAERHPFRAAFAAALLTAVLLTLLDEYRRSHHPFWAALALVAGAAVFAYAYARVFPKGVEPGALRERRRRREPA